jgi:hypothetical protein
MKNYKRILIDGKYKYLHRHIMETYLNRKLLDIEFVHHKNGNKFDNRIENLEILTNQKKHMIKHLKLKTFIKSPKKKHLKMTKAEIDYINLI